MGWATGSNIAQDVWEEVKSELDEEQQKRISKFLYNLFCEYDADDWRWEEGSLMYDAYKMNDLEEWKQIDKEMQE